MSEIDFTPKCQYCEFTFLTKATKAQHEENCCFKPQVESYGITAIESYENEGPDVVLTKLKEEFKHIAQKTSETILDAPIIYNGIPSYYGNNTSDDLYSFFISKFGLETWENHVIMECIQYLFRAKEKGQFESDIRKVIVICERILAERNKDVEKT